MQVGKHPHGPSMGMTVVYLPTFGWLIFYGKLICKLVAVPWMIWGINCQERSSHVGCQESPFAQVKAFCPESMAVSFFVDWVAIFVEIFVFLCFCLFLLNHEYCPLQSIATLGCPCNKKNLKTAR